MRESVAMSVFIKERNMAATRPLFSVVSPEKTSDLYNKYTGIIYPELKYDELKYVKKARDIFDKVRDVNFNIKASK